jgi:hypothetical protein
MPNHRPETVEMRPTVHDPRFQFDRQTRAYAEYRVFSALTPAAAGTTSISITLGREHDDAATHGAPAACLVRLIADNGEVLETRAAAHHPYAAIDRATELMLAALQDRAARVRALVSDTCAGGRAEPA